VAEQDYLELKGVHATMSVFHIPLPKTVSTSRKRTCYQCAFRVRKMCVQLLL